ncbi:CTD small phosphatase-like protein 2 isoform X2 [Chiloscyllium plagiosum]|nr:CTD small phosphatase-like protein 2 isoform X2 [Chiloscyllium plagiosum]XP_043577336.1 CTD small phosphatase-like protein 2 isoform X2 [Chiloscyllium plagiosum]XP_043577337.1 CTD small phosphatase-like protein 2 isoform X2 [Chiloscyllium plagiosum]XP_043577338.1 CTD small phosphatase-like protein 2 isoform X2 [Chiloscyllium plagiosum]
MNLRSGKAMSEEPLTPQTPRCTKGQDRSLSISLGRESGASSGCLHPARKMTPTTPKKIAQGVTLGPVLSEEGGDESNSFTTTPRATRLPGKHWQSTELNRGFLYMPKAAKLNIRVQFQDEHQGIETRGKTKGNQARALFPNSTLESRDVEANKGSAGDLEPVEMTFSIHFAADSSCLNDEREDFNQYKFIKKSQSSMKMILQKSILPLKTRSVPEYSLVLGLDEILVHCQLTIMEGTEFVFPVCFQDKSYQVYVKLRPYCKEFLENLSQFYEIILFTTATKDYVDKLLDILDPHRRLIRHRLYRKHCVCVQGNYIKELNILSRDLAKTVFVDNWAGTFCQVSNGIQIKSWLKDPNDQELQKLIPYLQKLAELDDVRPAIQRRYRWDRQLKRPKVVLRSQD